MNQQEAHNKELSNWKCYLFGNSVSGNGIVYTPLKGNVPNRFVRWMMKTCFACTWVKIENYTDSLDIK